MHALERSPLSILCVLDYAAARGILERAPRELLGKTLVNLTNGTPAHALEMADWATTGEHDTSTAPSS